MQPPKLDVLISFFAFGGNGGVATLLPAIAWWWSKTYHELKSDPRIGRIGVVQRGDIPLSMERNRVVKEAKEGGFDVVLMIDSDNVPDLYVGHREDAKPFWKSSFDFLYERKLQGIPTVVCAPYCGPPPHPVTGGEENVYVFYGEKIENDTSEPGIRFAAYSRDHASIMRGIKEIAAGPTGVIMYSTCAFDLMPIRQYKTEEILEMHSKGELTTSRAKQLIEMESWFYYEFTDAEQTKKASTEDVTNTREIQLAGIVKHGEPVVFCNWDSWAGHYKPKCVGKPEPLKIEHVSHMFAEAVRKNVSVRDEVVELNFGNDGIDDTGINLVSQGVSTGCDIMSQNWSPTNAVHRMVNGRKVLTSKANIETITEDDLSFVGDLGASYDPGSRFLVIGAPGEYAAVLASENTTTFFMNEERQEINNVNMIQVSEPLMKTIKPFEESSTQDLSMLVIDRDMPEIVEMLGYLKRHVVRGGVVLFPIAAMDALDAFPSEEWDEVETDGKVWTGVRRV